MQESNPMESMASLDAVEAEKFRAEEVKEKVFHTEIYDRVLDRATRMNRMEAMKHFKDGPRISSIGVAEVAEELDTSPHWVITGERDPWEVRVILCDDADGRKYNQSF